MAKGINKMILVGNIGRDPEIRLLNGGKKMAVLNIATTESWNDRESGERRELTEWTRVVLWNRLATVAEEYLRKGRQVYVEGPKRTRNYDDNGQTKYIVEIIANELQILGGRGDVADQSGPTYTNQQADNSMDDDVPL